MKQWLATGMLCDTKVVKGKFYKTIVRPAMAYGSECWVLNKKEEIKTKIEEMKMLR